MFGETVQSFPTQGHADCRLLYAAVAETEFYSVSQPFLCVLEIVGLFPLSCLKKAITVAIFIWIFLIGNNV